jgi:hypothetical protein
MTIKITGYTYLEDYYTDDVDIDIWDTEVNKAVAPYKKTKAKEHNCKVSDIFLIIKEKEQCE